MIYKQSSSYDPFRTFASTSDCKIPHHGNKAQKNAAAKEMSQISTCCNCWCHLSSPMIWRWKTTGAALKLNDTGSPELLFTNGLRSEFSYKRKSKFVIQRRIKLRFTFEMNQSSPYYDQVSVLSAYLHPR